MVTDSEKWNLRVLLRKGTIKIQKSREIHIDDMTMSELETKLDTLLKWLKPEVLKPSKNTSKK